MKPENTRADKRLFFAIPLPDPVSTVICNYIDDLDVIAVANNLKLRWVKQRDLHVTLKFLGETTSGLEMACIRQATAFFAKREPFELEVRGTGVFPNETHPQVLWVGLKSGSQQLAELALGLERQMSDIGFKSDPYPYAPHVTIARVPGSRSRSAAELIFSSKQKNFGSFRAEKIVLFESLLNNGGQSQDAGVEYDPVHEFILK